MKKYLIIMQQNPYANSKAMESLELAFALSSFEQEVSLLLQNEALLQLMPTQDDLELVAKPFTNVYSDIHLFGIKNVYIDEHSMHKYEPNELFNKFSIIDAATIAELIKSHDVVLTI